MSSPGSGDLSSTQNISIGAFVSSLGAGAATFGGLVLAFYILKLYFPRIYRPRTYLVPEKDRTQPPPPGLWRWLIPIFTTKNSEFIHKCGLDAFFFLRYLRMLLKLFVPMACIILPILLPINATGGNAQMQLMNTNSTTDTTSAGNTTISGLNVLAWSNVAVQNHNRFWAHLILAVLVIIYVCYTVFVELRSYIRIRQAYITSPQHRLRASATTVLVKTIPNKWNTVEALDGLFDVFPGGVRNIWINRDFQELSDKIDLRNDIANKLESAETNLVKKAKEKHDEEVKKNMKKVARATGKSKKELKKESIDHDGAAESKMTGNGTSAGNPHQIRSLRQFFHRDEGSDREGDDGDDGEGNGGQRQSALGLGVVGEGLGHGFEAVGQGLRGVTRFGGQGIGAVTHGVGRLTRFGRRQEQLDTQRVSPSADSADDDTTARPSTEPNAASTHTDTPLSPMSPRTVQAKQDAKLLSSGFDDLDIVTQSHWQFWKKSQPMPSPQPHTKENDPFAAQDKAASDPTKDIEEGEGLDSHVDSDKSEDDAKAPKKKKTSTYPPAYDSEVANAEDKDALWRKYIKPGDRESMRLKLFGWNWMPFLPTWLFLGKKVDTIYYCRKELARLNLEIEADQREPEKYPLMNSAFIQFNHQVGAHMACQAVSHHLPQQMSPRMLEIAPDDVIWDNMAIKWWEAYIRNFAVILIIVAMVVFWAIPSIFVGGLSQLDNLEKLPGFEFVGDLSKTGKSLVQGIVPAVITSLLFVIVPFILKFLHRIAGASTGNQVQQNTQMSYFAFLFVNLFLVVTIAAGISSIVSVLQENISNPALIPSFLAKNLPRASNYFFSYMILQALSTSSGSLAQVATLLVWLLLAPLLDSTARQKWRRQINLPTLNWGTFFPPYTNFACIGLIYSIIAPLIMVFNIITFSLFWVAYRYNTLYVNNYRFDTGGLLFPTACNQLFTGLYVMEICLIGLFFLVQQPDPNNPDDKTAVCKAQGIIMIVVGILTIIYQILLNYAFGPLLRYLPITLEDDAVMRDEAFARAQDSRWGREHEDEDEDDEAQHGTKGSGNVELQDLSATGSRTQRSPRTLSPGGPWSRARRNSRSGEFGRETVDLGARAPSPRRPSTTPRRPRVHKTIDVVLHPPESKKGRQDLEAQASVTNAEGYLFGGVSDTIEDLTPAERDALVDRAFRHRALRARRPCIWIPRDALGVADDEIRATDRLTDYVWISDEGAVLADNGKVVFRRSPPDFSDIDVVEL